METIQFRHDVKVELRKYAAEDRDVIEAMMVSSTDDEITQQMLEEGTPFGKINFLMKNRHGTPFEHTFFKFYMEMPIFVFREFHRHRIGWSYNEQSGRYRELPPIYYIPGPERNLFQVGKPGDYEFIPGDQAEYDHLVDEMVSTCQELDLIYRNRLGDGIAKEVARMTVPVNLYSAQFASCNARSLMAFLELRTLHPEAARPSKPMREIAMVADKMEEMFEMIMPLTYKAFVQNGRQCP
jgi:thymidylate synthase (FAD)